MIRNPTSLIMFLLYKTNPSFYRKITNPKTKVKINKPEPYSYPTEFVTPSSSSDYMIEVITSPAPLAKAIRVALATALGILRLSDILVKEGATYFSIIELINLNNKRIVKMQKTKDSILFSLK